MHPELSCQLARRGLRLGSLAPPGASGQQAPARAWQVSLQLLTDGLGERDLATRARASRSLPWEYGLRVGSQGERGGDVAYGQLSRAGARGDWLPGQAYRASPALVSLNMVSSSAVKDAGQWRRWPEVRSGSAGWVFWLAPQKRRAKSPMLRSAWRLIAARGQ